MSDLVTPPGWKYALGQFVRKRSGAQWSGRIVGFYSTEQTPRGYAVESRWHKNTVQIYPEAALEPAP